MLVFMTYVRTVFPSRYNDGRGNSNRKSREMMEDPPLPGYGFFTTPCSLCPKVSAYDIIGHKTTINTDKNSAVILLSILPILSPT